MYTILVKELILTVKQSGDLIREYDHVHPNPSTTVTIETVIDWIEQYYDCKVQSSSSEVVLKFYDDSDLTFFLLKHPC